MVRNGHVVGRERLGRTVIERRGQRVIDGVQLANVLHGAVGISGGHFDAETEIVKLFFVAFEVVPNRAGLGIIFGINTARRAVERPVARCFGGINQVTFTTVSGGGARFHPFVGIHAHHPAVPVGRDISVAVKVVRHGKAFRQCRVVGHDVYIFQRLGFIAIGKRRFQTITRQGRLPFSVGILPQNLIVGAVFFGNKHNVFNVGEHTFSRRLLLKLKIVGNHFLGQRCQLSVGGNINDRNGAFHQTAHVTSFGAGFKIGPSVGAAAESFGVGNDQLFSVGRYFQFGWKPTRGNMPQHFQARNVNYGYGINARFGHVQTLLVGRGSHAERNQSAQFSQTGVGLQRNGINDRIFLNINHRHAVVVAVADKYIFFRGSDRVGTAATHGREVFNHLTDQKARFGFVFYLPTRAVGGITPDRKRLRCIGAAQRGNTFGGVAFFHFLAAVFGRGPRMRGFFEVFRVQIGKGFVLKHAHVGHVNALLIGRKTDAERIAARGHIVHYALGFGIDHHHPKPDLVHYVKAFAVVGKHQVTEVAVLVIFGGAVDGALAFSRIQVK